MVADPAARDFPLPLNEDERLRELYDLDLLDAGPIEQVDRICALARDLFSVPVALVTLIDRDKQCFLATAGIDLTETRRQDAFCNITILQDEPLAVADAAEDPRFKDNAFVCGPPHVRFYAGAPLNLAPGINIGSLCIIDMVPRQLSVADLAHLSALADVIVSELRGRRVARDLAAGRTRLAQAAHMAKIGGYEFNCVSEKLVWDDEIYQIYGIPRESPPSNDVIVERYDPETREASLQRLNALFRHGIPYDVELRGTRPNGETFWVRAMAEPEIIDGQLCRIFGAVQDITDRKLAEERMRDLAFRDTLTGLPNRAAFIDKLDVAVKAAENERLRVALLKFDVDHFREVNDALGHKIGDGLLQTIASTLWQEFSSFGTVARIGGNEFALMLRGPEVDKAESYAAAFIEQTKTLFRGQSAAFPVGLSCGIAIFPDHGPDSEAIIKNAKVALLQAKEQQRGKVVTFDPGMREALDARNTLLRRVWAGIESGEFVLFYQPIIGLRSGKVAGLEALIRWNDPEFGLLTPGHFMPAFDDPELALALGDMVLHMAIGQMRKWLDAGVDFGNVAVNLSTAQFRRGDLAEIVLGKLDRGYVPPQRLALEVTENVYMAWGADVVAETVRTLHDAGVEIALDDFGTGYASLTHLRQFPIDKLKIDKSFVQSPESAAIVDAVINMGLSLGMRVVAEGVETPEQLNLLRLKGCDFVQGYIFAKPMEAERVAPFIAGFAADAGNRRKIAVSG
jgi:diguanylate cyclase (GGDEF)-like protein